MRIRLYGSFRGPAWIASQKEVKLTSLNAPGSNLRYEFIVIGIES